MSACAERQAIGTASSYDELQAIMRRRADALDLSRQTIDEISGLSPGYAGKILAEVPVRKLGPETLGPMLGALGLTLLVVEDAKVMARFTARAAKRQVRCTKLHADAVQVKFSRAFLRRIAKKGGHNSRKYMTDAQATELARRANHIRWHASESVEVRDGVAT